ncbi:MAG: rod shape-determining protein MreC [Deltaproteobacteria bacterium]|nr:rod shape-determining protein MreC [Deltaproteobacteria bacterium]
MVLFLLALALLASYAQNPRGLASAGAIIPLTILGPVSAGINWVADGVEGWWRRYFSLANASRENEQLRLTLARLRRQVVDLEEARQANDRLTRLLELKKQRPLAFIAARILAWDPGPWYQVVVVDVGALDEVRLEAAVVCDEGLVGRVVELAARQAKVLLVTDRSSGVDAFIQRNRLNVLVTGLGSGRMELQYVAKGEDVRLGDLVVSSGLDGIFPAGQALGVVSQVDKAGLGLFLRSELRPTVEFSGLKEILILKDQPQALDWTTLGDDSRALFQKKGPKAKRP